MQQPDHCIEHIFVHVMSPLQSVWHCVHPFAHSVGVVRGSASALAGRPAVNARSAAATATRERARRVTIPTVITHLFFLRLATGEMWSRVVIHGRQRARSFSTASAFAMPFSPPSKRRDSRMSGVSL